MIDTVQAQIPGIQFGLFEENSETQHSLVRGLQHARLVLFAAARTREKYFGEASSPQNLETKVKVALGSNPGNEYLLL